MRPILEVKNLNYSYSAGTPFEHKALDNISFSVVPGEFIGIIAMEPRCIVLDDPTAMLDPRGRKEVIDTVSRLNREKRITVVLITHHMDEAAKADRVVVLNKGKVAADGTPREVLSQVELLHDIGLASPETVALCWELNRQGRHLPLDALEPEECAQALYNLVKA